MPRVKRGTVRRAKRKKLLARAKGLLPDQEQAVSPGQRVGRYRRQVRVRRTQEQEARLPAPLDRADQRGRPRERAHLLAADARTQGCWQHPRSEDAGRAWPRRSPKRSPRWPRRRRPRSRPRRSSSTHMRMARRSGRAGLRVMKHLLHVASGAQAPLHGAHV